MRVSRFVVGRLEAGMAGGTLQEFSELLGGIAQVDEPADKFFVYAVRMFFLRYGEGRDRLSNVSITSLSTLRYNIIIKFLTSGSAAVTSVSLPSSYYQDHTTTLLDGGASSGRYTAMFCLEYSVTRVLRNGPL